MTLRQAVQTYHVFSQNLLRIVLEIASMILIAIKFVMNLKNLAAQTQRHVTMIHLRMQMTAHVHIQAATIHWHVTISPTYFVMMALVPILDVLSPRLVTTILTPVAMMDLAYSRAVRMNQHVTSIHQPSAQTQIHVNSLSHSEIVLVNVSMTPTMMEFVMKRKLKAVSIYQHVTTKP